MKVGDIDLMVIPHSTGLRLLIHTRLQNYETVPVSADTLRELARYLETEVDRFPNRKETR